MSDKLRFHIGILYQCFSFCQGDRIGDLAKAQWSGGRGREDGGTSFNNQITGISVKELWGYMNGPNRSYRDYKSQESIYRVGANAGVWDVHKHIKKSRAKP